MSAIKIKKGYIPGAVGSVIALHGRYYHENWGFESYFEVKVARGLSEFMGRYDDQRDGFWTVAVKGQVKGAIALDGIHAEDEGAHLRWFIVSDQLQGQGVGQQLIDRVIAFCKEKKYPTIYLWTFEGLLAARHLYDKKGFKVVEERIGTEWGKAVNEQRLVLRL